MSSGGARRGAGRKASEPLQRVHVWLTAKQVRVIDDASARLGIDRSKSIRRMLQFYLDGLDGPNGAPRLPRL